MRHQILFLFVLVTSSSACTIQLPHLNQSQLYMVSVGNMVHQPIGPMDIYRKTELTDETEPFRIHVHYDENHYSPFINMANLEKVKSDLIPEIVQFFQSAFQVRKLSKGNTTLGRKCVNSMLGRDYGLSDCSDEGCITEEKCYTDIRIPEEHLKACTKCDKNRQNCKSTEKDGVGFDGHFVIYATFLNTTHCAGGTLAYALTCRIGDNHLLNRPLAGHMNICPDILGSGYKMIRGMLKSVLTHELTHALAFNADLFPFFHDEDGVPRTKRAADGYPPTVTGPEDIQYYQHENVVEVVESPWWTPSNGYLKKIRAFVITPKVVKEVRAHFNCHHPDIKGAELEDQERGQGVTVENTTYLGSHFEQRIFMDHQMAPTTASKMRYSRLLMAFMEDTGWYKANYSLAEPTVYGKNAGCDFLEKSCGEYMKDRMMKNESTSPYCFDSLLKPNFDPKNSRKMMCGENRDEVLEICSVGILQKDLEPLSQNFDASIVGPDYKRIGGASFANYCPVVASMVDRNGPQLCPFHKPEPNGGWVEDSMRKCIDVRDVLAENCSSSLSQPLAQAACATTICRDKRLYLKSSKGTVYPCYYDGQEIKLMKLNGSTITHYTLICPECSEICGENFCKNDSGPNKPIGDPDDLYQLNCTIPTRNPEYNTDEHSESILSSLLQQLHKLRIHLLIILSLVLALLFIRKMKSRS